MTEIQDLVCPDCGKAKHYQAKRCLPCSIIDRKNKSFRIQANCIGCDTLFEKYEWETKQYCNKICKEIHLKKSVKSIVS